MKTMEITRRGLLEIVSGPRPGRDQSGLDFEVGVQSEKRMIAYWRDDDNALQRDLPHLIVVPEDDQTDLFAWTFTYIPTLRPFTGLVRVLDTTMASLAVRNGLVPESQVRTEAAVCLIMCETVSTLSSRSDPTQLITPSNCANSLSFAVMRAQALGFDKYHLDIAGRWQLTRELANQRQRITDPGEVVLACRVLLASQRPSNLMEPSDASLYENACREIVSSHEIGEATWSAVIGDQRELLDVPRQMKESRENRVRAFESAWTQIANLARRDSRRASFACGYLASRIAPGELDHINLLARRNEALPNALLWFGVCCGLSSNGDVLAYRGGIGYRVLRDLERGTEVLERPECDIAIDEMKVLLRRDKPLAEFRTSANGWLNVELAPGVLTSVRWPINHEGQLDLFEQRNAALETRSVVRELGTALERVNYLRARLERALESGSPATSSVGKEGRTRRRL